MLNDQPIALAKHLPRDEKRPFLEKTLASKVSRMKEILALWKRLRRKTDDYWPTTRLELRLWDDPPRGIYKFSDPAITSPKKDDPLQKNLVELMEEFDRTRYQLQNFRTADDPETMKYANKEMKNLNVELMSQISRLQILATEFRLEIKRVSPDSKYLRKEWDIF
ncbi:hypothetical protein [Rhizobium laguerreae]|uniref:hypothetical protein n=1 Tax=Rhizobium laguerreae TaxID=1076926 RepID=UPI001C92B6F0|nr:hypothetical protein [Rhizobium laguerreae]MBY3201768.1 hypothetical protein [Rhizobium laguerreae]